MKRTTCVFPLGILLLAGCAAESGLEKLPPDHPANPAAAEAQLPEPSASLVQEPSVPRNLQMPPAGSAHAGRPTADDLVNINKLPETDRAVAARQLTCPVGGEPLGSMGVPRKMIVGGRSVFLCCKGCETEFNASPDKFLGKGPGLLSGPLQKGGEK